MFSGLADPYHSEKVLALAVTRRV